MRQIILVAVLLVSPIWSHSIPKRLTAQSALQKTNGRIVGGDEASDGQFPFSAALYITQVADTYFCGGTLLNSLYILTSAQCAYTATEFRIELGSVQRTEEDSNRETLTAHNYVIHPDFDILQFTKSDIALVQTEEPVQFTSFIQPIGSLPEFDLQSGLRGTAIGWGQVSDLDFDLSEILLSVSLEVVLDIECQILYGSNTIDDTVLCLQGDLGKGSCVGDTGSPFFIIDANGQSTVIGIAGFVSSLGCDSVFPSGYARVFPFVDWINDNIKSGTTESPSTSTSEEPTTTTEEPTTTTEEPTTTTEEPTTTTEEPTSTTEEPTSTTEEPTSTTEESTTEEPTSTTEESTTEEPTSTTEESTTEESTTNTEESTTETEELTTITEQLTTNTEVGSTITLVEPS